MTLPSSLILVAMLVLVIVFLVGAAAHIIHILRFGMVDRRNHVVILLFVAFSAFVLMGGWLYVQSVDWTQTFTVPLPSFPLS